MAHQILTDAGRELGRAAAAVASALELGSPLPLALGGGVLLNSRVVHEAALAWLGQRELMPTTVLVTEPAHRAVRLAAESLRAP